MGSEMCIRDSLGTSLARIEERLQQLRGEGHRAPLDAVGWPDVVNFIRRAPPAHKRWLAKGRKAEAGAAAEEGESEEEENWG